MKKIRQSHMDTQHSLLNKIKNCKKCDNFNKKGVFYKTPFTSTVDCIFIAQNPSSKWYNSKENLENILPFDLPNFSKNSIFEIFSIKYKEKYKKDFNFYVTNVVKCATIDNKITNNMIFNCSEFLINELDNFYYKTPIIFLGKQSEKAISYIKNENFYFSKHPSYLKRFKFTEQKLFYDKLFNEVFTE